MKMVLRPLVGARHRASGLDILSLRNFSPTPKMCLGLIVLALTVRISPDTLIVCVVKPGALIQVDMACMEPVNASSINATPCAPSRADGDGTTWGMTPAEPVCKLAETYVSGRPSEAVSDTSYYCSSGKTTINVDVVDSDAKAKLVHAAVEIIGTEVDSEVRAAAVDGCLDVLRTCHPERDAMDPGFDSSTREQIVEPQGWMHGALEHYSNNADAWNKIYMTSRRCAGIWAAHDEDMSEIFKGEVRLQLKRYGTADTSASAMSGDDSIVMAVANTFDRVGPFLTLACKVLWGSVGMERNDP